MDAGELVSRMNVDLDLDDDDLVTDVIVLAKVLDSMGNVSLASGVSEGCDWLTQLALLTAAGETMGEPQLRDE